MFYLNFSWHPSECPFRTSNTHNSYMISEFFTRPNHDFTRLGRVDGWLGRTLIQHQAALILLTSLQWRYKWARWRFKSPASRLFTQSGEDQRKHQSSASLTFVRGIHRWPVNSPHKRPVTRKMFPFDDVIMTHAFSLHVSACHPGSLHRSRWPST